MAKVRPKPGFAADVVAVWVCFIDLPLCHRGKLHRFYLLGGASDNTDLANTAYVMRPSSPKPQSHKAEMG
jgi:hypothetical protein